MTLGDGKRKVYMLLEEYSSGGEITKDEDIEAKMADFFDMAQKDMAEVRRIEKLHTVEREDNVTDYAMPADFMALKAVWADGKRTRRLSWRAGKLIIPETERAEISVEYFAVPETIGPTTPDSYEFEIGEDAAQALPFYVAAQQLISDLVIDYSAPWGIYRLRKQEIEQQGNGGTRLVNTFYR